jgi:hypothetical protein
MEMGNAIVTGEKKYAKLVCGNLIGSLTSKNKTTSLGGRICKRVRNCPTINVLHTPSLLARGKIKCLQDCARVLKKPTTVFCRTVPNTGPRDM